MSLAAVFAFLLILQPQDSTDVSTLVQPNPLPATPAESRMEAADIRRRLRETSLVKNIAFENIGPTIMSGRVTDLDVNQDDPTEFYVAYASGGLWKTVSNGSDFEPLFDRQPVMTIGDIAVDWDRGETIWVGTGENNSSRSSYAGNGVYRSRDKGETWEHLGLSESHHVGRIRIHPDDENTVWVAALGHLYSPNEQRGVFKTTDGGKTWDHALSIDENTGIIDLVMDPANPDVLLAAAWHRTRRAWNFIESGTTSGIYRTSDGGDTWTLLTTPESGFPAGPGIGRIGLAVARSNSDIVYALVDNQNLRPEEEDEEEEAEEEEEEEEEEEAVVTRDLLRTISVDDFLALEDEDIEAFLREEDFPERYDALKVLEMVEDETITPVALVEYLEDANEALVDTDVIGAEVYRSDDGGRTWRRTHEGFIDSFYNTYGYYFGEIRVAPQDPDKIYILGVPFLKSEDGGATFESIGRENVHADHQALWVNPERPGHLIDGNDGGLNVSYDDGETWFKLNTPAVGQFYAIAVDMADPYRVYGGLQDNGVWMGPSTYTASRNWHSSGDYPYDRLYGGDGMHVEVDRRTNDIVYTGSQFGYYSRINLSTGERTRIRPQHDLGERPLRFNWQTPIHLSRHNQDILYLGSHQLHRSLDRGSTFEAISRDLTRGGKPGNVPFGTLTSISESPLRFGLIYTGSDDGLVHMTPDGGVTWQDISEGLPQHLWISRIIASAHDEDVVYVTLNGYRWDHFEAYLYVSRDRGETWNRIGTDLPAEPLNVVKEDPDNPDLLYVGSDHGTYASLDGGEHFMGLAGGMPDAPVHDLVVHGRERDLLVGTHGRSIFKGNIAHLQAAADSLMALPLTLLEVEEVRYSERWGEKSWAWGEVVEPEAEIVVVAPDDGTATLRVLSDEDFLLYEWEESVDRGLNYVAYDLSVDSLQASSHDRMRGEAENEEELEKVASEPAEDTGRRYLLPGSYRLQIEWNGRTEEKALVVVEG